MILHAEQFDLLSVELLFSQLPLRFQRTEALQLRNHVFVAQRGHRLRLGRRRSILLLLRTGCIHRVGICLRVFLRRMAIHCIAGSLGCVPTTTAVAAAARSNPGMTFLLLRVLERDKRLGADTVRERRQRRRPDSRRSW